MQITVRQKIYAVSAAVLMIAAAFAIDSIRPMMNISRLEREASSAAARAEQSQAAYDAAMRIATVNAARAEYLGQQLEEIRSLAKKQDEEIKKIDVDINTARGRADRARQLGAVESTAHELCDKLESLGHPCR